MRFEGTQWPKTGNQKNPPIIGRGEQISMVNLFPHITYGDDGHKERRINENVPCC